MIYPPCSTCRSWGVPRDRLAGSPFRRCMAIAYDRARVVEDEPGDWLGEAERAGIRAFHAAHRAVAVDVAGDGAAVKTRGDFGCVLHEPA